MNAHLFICSVGLCVLAFSSKARAQLGMSDNVPAVDATDAVSTLEALTVTAVPLNAAYEVNVGAFGARDSMEVPLAIQSYDASTIRRASARTAMDVLAVDSSISGASLGSSFDSFRLRGFKIDNFNSIRRDGIAVLPYHDEGLENIERIDVLKGPSGFLYGFNSPGGTVNYLLKRPTKDRLLHLTTSGSSLNGRYVALDASDSGFGGQFGWRINTAYEKVGDFNHAGDLERKFVSLATDFCLGERILLQLNADWYRKGVVADPLLRADQSGRTDPLDPSTYILPPRVSRRDLLAPSWWRYKTEVTNIDARVEYRLNSDWVSVTQVAYSHLDGGEIFTDYFDIQPNGDIGYADLYAFREERFSNRAVQSYLSGQFNSGRVQHNAFLGGSMRELRGNTPQSDFIESVGGVTVEQISVGNVLSPTQPPKWTFGPRNPVAFRMNIKESSVYASDLIHLTEQFQVLLGGRYIWYRASELQEGVPSQRKDVFVPTGAVVYRLNGKLMTYLSHSRGFEAGDYAPYNANNANEPTAAIESRQVELGAKMDIAPKFNAGLALFEIERDASYLNTANDFVSSGRFQHRGIELNATSQFERLGLYGNAAYLDTELKAVSDPDTLGKRSEGVPRWKSAVGARYAFAALAGLSVDTLVSYVGSRPADAQNSGLVPSYTLWDAGISYETKLGTLPTTLRLYGKNIGDKYYYPSVYYLGGLQLGRGREIFFSAQISF